MNLVRSIVRETLRLWYGSRRPIRKDTVRVCSEQSIPIAFDQERAADRVRDRLVLWAE